MTRIRPRYFTHREAREWRVSNATEPRFVVRLYPIYRGGNVARHLRRSKLTRFVYRNAHQLRIHNGML